MGLFKRLHRITVGRVEAFLTSVEDPEVVFPQLVREMNEQLGEATSAEASATAAVKKAQRDLGQFTERADRMGRGAALAVKRGDEATARDAVKAQLDAESGQARAQVSLDQAKATADRAAAARQRIQQQLAELKAKKGEILTRARVAKTQKRIAKTVSGSVGSSDSILDAVARLESQVEETEAELEIQARLAGETTVSASLEKRLADLDRDAEIEKRLDALRKQAAGA